MLITDRYRGLNAEHHRREASYGGVGGNVENLVRIAEAFGTKDILDYGCGKGVLARHMPWPIKEYDPAIPGKVSQARILRIGSLAAPAELACQGIRSHTLQVVQIEEHGRIFRGGQQQVFEFSHSMLADDVPLICGGQVPVGAFGDVDVEMVEPEIHHHFIELAFAIDSAQ